MLHVVLIMLSTAIIHVLIFVHHLLLIAVLFMTQSAT